MSSTWGASCSRPRATATGCSLLLSVRDQPWTKSMYRLKKVRSRDVPVETVGVVPTEVASEIHVERDHDYMMPGRART